MDLIRDSLDAEVAKLCARDGGVTIYETVHLPSAKFNEWGQPNFYKPTQGEDALGTEYLFKSDYHHYLEGNPSMSRYHYEVVRKSDKKLLGETTLYGRGGGDLPGPWHDSSFSCPSPSEAGDVALLQRIFIQEGK